jgi:arylsulfatase
VKSNRRDALSLMAGGRPVSPPVKLAIPLLFNLYTNPREDQDKVITDSWIFGPVLKMVGEFDASVKKYPLIAMGTPDPYGPPR